MMQSHREAAVGGSGVGRAVPEGTKLYLAQLREIMGADQERLDRMIGLLRTAAGRHERRS